jgi:hypothetical protein
MRLGLTAPVCDSVSFARWRCSSRLTALWRCHTVQRPLRHRISRDSESGTRPNQTKPFVDL